MRASIPSIDIGPVLDGQSHATAASQIQDRVTPYAWEGQYLARQYDRMGGSYGHRAA